MLRSAARCASEGQACPLNYAYSPSQIKKAKPLQMSPVTYVIGGLYGNRFALDEIEHMRRREVHSTQFIFNGDFNFFNSSTTSFIEINERLRSDPLTECLLGNVEIAVASDWEFKGCGCDYPPYVDDETVSNADEIVRKLKMVSDRVDTKLDSKSEQKPCIRRWLNSLERFCVLGDSVNCGDKKDEDEEDNKERVAILHGDFRSLSGWKFAAETMDPPDKDLRARFKIEDDYEAIVPEKEVESAFLEAGVGAYCSTHTCLAFAQRFENGILFNNGSAGMSNFVKSTFGVITRISCDLNDRAPNALYGCNWGGRRFEGKLWTF